MFITLNLNDPNRFMYPVNGRDCYKSCIDFFIANIAVMSKHTHTLNQIISRSSHNLDGNRFIALKYDGIDQCISLTDHKLIITNVSGHVSKPPPSKSQVLKFILPGHFKPSNLESWNSFYSLLSGDLLSSVCVC